MEMRTIIEHMRFNLHSWMLLVVFFNDTATTEIYTLSLHDALPISLDGSRAAMLRASRLEPGVARGTGQGNGRGPLRSEEHTSELQSRLHLVCRLLLEKKRWIKYLERIAL